MKKILLIGGEGYIGSTLSRMLIDDGWSVTCFDPLIYSEKENSEQDLSNLRIVKASISDISIITF
jgi:nucleoside-diphosphate-sugar epimerase